MLNTQCIKRIYLFLMFCLIWRKCGNSLSLKKSLGNCLSWGTSGVWKLFVPKRGEATDSGTETFAARSAALAADVLRVLPIVWRHSTVGLLSHCGEKYKTNAPQISGRGWEHNPELIILGVVCELILNLETGPAAQCCSMFSSSLCSSITFTQSTASHCQRRFLLCFSIFN